MKLLKMIFLWPLILILIVGCGKSTETNSEGDELIPALVVKCGHQQCLPSSSSNIGLTRTFLDFLPKMRLAQNTNKTLQVMRQFFWFAVGYPSSQEYDNTKDTNIGNAGVDGLVGHIEAFRKTILEVVALTYSPKSCQELVALDGKLTLDSGATLAFSPAENSIPSTFQSPGRLEKRLTYVSFDTDSPDVKITAVFEFSCSQKAVNAILTEQKNETLLAKNNIFYEKSENGISLDLYSYGSTNEYSESDLRFAFLFRTDESKETFQSWLTRSALSPRPFGYRYVVHSNFSNEQTSFLSQDVAVSSDDSISQTEWNALDSVNDDSVSGLTAPASAQETDRIKIGGCAPNFDANLQTSVTSSTPCADLPLSQAPTPAIDASGDLSLKWVQSGLKSAL